MQSSLEPWIGIDLGTRNSCVGLWRNGRVEILQNDEGSTTTPSCVQFGPDQEIVVGQRASVQAARVNTTTFFDIKRLIGKKFSDLDSFTRLTQNYEIVKGKHDRPFIKFE